VIRRSEDYFCTLLPYSAAASSLIVPATSTNAERVAMLKLDSSGRGLWCAVPKDNVVEHYLSQDDGETWVRV